MTTMPGNGPAPSGRATYALMLSLLPATATIIGLVVLAQVPTVVEVAGEGPVASAMAFSFAWPVFLLAALGALLGLILLGRERPVLRMAPAALAAVLLVGAQLGEATATDAVATRMRFGHMDDYAPWGARQQDQAEVDVRVSQSVRNRRRDAGD